LLGKLRGLILQHCIVFLHLRVFELEAVADVDEGEAARSLGGAGLRVDGRRHVVCGRQRVVHYSVYLRDGPRLQSPHLVSVHRVILHLSLLIIQLIQVIFKVLIFELKLLKL
jgi:hypothetical protein